ncbi:MAG: rhomboid family intramembrane serine protease [Deltaproteobacteria bacterium]|nr:rhomboid family intramembrane serine protease [Deltaproteobacteria bacterium]
MSGFESISNYFKRHEEQAFIVKASLTIFLIIWLREFLSGFIGLFILLFPVFFLLYIRLKAASSGESATDLLKQHITFMPFMYAEGERKKEGIAWATYSIILVNIVIFYGIELNPLIDTEFLFNNFMFIPEKPVLWNTPISAFTAIFLHGSDFHLWGNMIFLWVVGTVVERRIGWQKFLLLYFITGLLAGLAYITIHYIFMGEVGHALGASGAIAGIMGIFAVRCYFKSMVFPLPILGIFSLILPVSLKVRLNSLVIMGLFFLLDLSGGIGQISGENFSNIGHWAHIGGMVGGMTLAGFMGLGKGAIEERHLEIGINASNEGIGLGEAEHSLRIALEKNPNNSEALLHLARIKSKFTLTDEGRDFYQKAIQIVAASKPQEAAALYREYYSKYLKGVEPMLQYRLAGIFYKSKDLDMASRCLEILANSANTPPEIRERSMFQCAMVLEEMGLNEAAKGFYSHFLEAFPQSSAVPKAKAKLGKA